MTRCTPLQPGLGAAEMLVFAEASPGAGRSLVRRFLRALAVGISERPGDAGQIYSIAVETGAGWAATEN